MHGIPLKEGEALVSLLYCALNGTPYYDNGADMQAVFALAKRHMVEATVFPAVKDLPLDDALLAAWERAYRQAQKKSLAFSALRTEVFSRLCGAGVKLLPVKGERLARLYGETVRQFSDQDVLFLEENVGSARTVMESIGFHSPTVSACHDKYVMEPFYSFELHRTLFEEGKFGGYFASAWERAVCVEGNLFRMREEDEYVYIIAHYYKHFSSAGAGIRSLADVYLLNKHRAPSFDRGYVNGVLEMLGLKAFEQKAVSIATAWLGEGDLTNTPAEDREYILSCGAYGTFDNYAENRVKREGCGALISYLFPPKNYLSTAYPVLKKAPVLLPAIWAWRMLKNAFNKKAWKRLGKMAQKSLKGAKNNKNG